MSECSTSIIVRAAVYDLMRRFGLTTVFGNPGSTELAMFLSFPADFRYILGLQESVVVGMADGFAQASGNASLVNLHSAAGVGNAMGNIFAAFRNHTPIVITAGQQARSLLPFDPFLASIQATELPKPYVKWSIEPARASDVPLAFARAYYTAMLPPRGPVFLSIPADDWDQPSELVPEKIVATAMRPDPQTMDRIESQLDNSMKPAFVVGAGVDRDGAWSEVLRLAEAHNARVWAAPRSGRCSFPENHPLFAGFLPRFARKSSPFSTVTISSSPSARLHSPTMSKAAGPISRKTHRSASSSTIRLLPPGLPPEPSLWAAFGSASSIYWLAHHHAEAASSLAGTRSSSATVAAHDHHLCLAGSAQNARSQQHYRRRSALGPFHPAALSADHSRGRLLYHG